jgi:hypothetical protein
VGEGLSVRGLRGRAEEGVREDGQIGEGKGANRS